MDTPRITNPIFLGPNIQSGEYVEAEKTPQATAGRQGELLPAGTSVSQEIRSVFDLLPGIDAELLAQTAAACTNPELRKASRFNAALLKTLAALQQKHSQTAGKAASLLQELLADQQLLADYRATLLG